MTRGPKPEADFVYLNTEEGVKVVHRCLGCRTVFTPRRLDHTYCTRNCSQTASYHRRKARR